MTCRVNESFTTTLYPVWMNATLPTEVHLIRALHQHQSADFIQLYDAYAPALYGMLLRLVKDPACAENLLQEAFVKIWSTSRRYDPQQGRLFSWMIAITRNLALDELNAQGIRPLERSYRHERPTESIQSMPVEAGVLETRSGHAA